VDFGLHAKNNRTRWRIDILVEGDPAALLMLEVKSDTEADLVQQKLNAYWRPLMSGIKLCSPNFKNADVNKAIGAEKAGLGLLEYLFGDRKQLLV